MKPSVAKALERRKKAANRKKSKRPNWHFKRNKAARKAARQGQRRGFRR